MASISTDHASPPPAGKRHKRGARRRVAAWVRGPTFARDITAVLVVKLALLAVLKFAFFNHPQAEHMSLPPAVVAEKLLSVPAPSGDPHHDQ
ncbi:cytochrome oxidase putative small subunit CydP [Burkholderia guangdongensis]|uniref:cytochrome oxidase putative small subunit CydP n=1 Tax=Burkholderia guangdongensis TaxID=1792500 RepID=UPI0015C7735A|nr:cytochrome oxidase putative small subunit CydP [Burkholderia guangdongensis]